MKLKDLLETMLFVGGEDYVELVAQRKVGDETVLFTYKGRLVDPYDLLETLPSPILDKEVVKASRKDDSYALSVDGRIVRCDRVITIDL